jgi:hypothetical protein
MTIMTSKQRAVGIFPTYESTEAALVELKDRGFSMHNVSVVGRDIHRHHELTGANVSDRLEMVGNLHTDENDSNDSAKAGAAAGSALGGITGLLVGLGAIAIPTIGPIMLAGAAATAIATTISGTVIGAAAGSLAGGLIGLGLPADRADTYSDRISEGHYLVMVEGGESDIMMAQEILHDRKIGDWYTYDVPMGSPRSAVLNTPQNRM